MKLQQGDILYKDGDTSKWWDTSSTNPRLHETRPATPLQNEFAAHKYTNQDERGNPYLSTIWATVPDSLQTRFPQTGMFDSTWAFTVDFQFNNGVVFKRKHPDKLPQLVNFYRLSISMQSSEISKIILVLKQP